MTTAPALAARSLIRLAIAAALLPAAALAQHKVVGADGRVTYSDRPSPAAAPATRVPVPGSTAGPATAPASAPALPYELRAVSARYPVTLYATRACAACDTGRQLLRQRGIPYSERLVADGDGELLQRQTGGRELPALTIGSQVLRGFAADQWMSYLDAAGYPRQSRLPASHPVPAAVPLAAGRTQAAADAVGNTPAQNSAEPAPPAAPTTPGGIRF